MAKKMWGGRFKKDMHPALKCFSYSLETDKELFDAEIRVNGAYAKMLARVGLITVAESKAILRGLASVAQALKGQDLAAYADRYEDVHTLIQMELEKKGHKTFNPLHHFFGYEGRCGWPTKFDMNYTFSLGMTGMLLVANGLTGYMSCVRNLVDTTDKWVPAGIPLTLMMDTKAKPRIKSVKVDLNGGPFLEYYKMRDSWKTHSD